jgi:hypothetical protein
MAWVPGTVSRRVTTRAAPPTRYLCRIAVNAYERGNTAKASKSAEAGGMAVTPS